MQSRVGVFRWSSLAQHITELEMVLSIGFSRQVTRNTSVICIAFEKMQMWTVAVLFLFGFSVVEGVLISPCGDDGVREVLADKDTVFICNAEGRVQWRLRYNWSRRSTLLAECEDVCHETNDFNKLFAFSIIQPRHSSSLTIRTVNHTDTIQLMNRSLECTLSEAGAKNVARCDLNYVYPPELVACSAANTSWSVNVSCVIDSVYSSRGLYTCQFFLLKHGSKNESLGTVTMLKSPPSKNIAKNEVKVSGFCQFNTTLPAEEGRYRFYVTVSPGGRTFQANFAADNIWLTTERPSWPIMSCAPQPYVLENTDVTCSCSATSLGQPAASLRWIRGNTTHQWTASSQNQQNQLHNTQPLTLKDHGITWFRCDANWGPQEIKGENYTAKVGYSVKTLKFLINGYEQNQTAKEGEQVNIRCESDGRPTPEIAIYNNNNGTVFIKDMSSVNYTFVTRCEDTATYTCSAWNEFSRQSGVTTSVSVDIDVLCKPRRRSSKHLIVQVVNQQAEVHFDIIANPVPHEYHVRLRSWMNTSESTDDDAESSLMNIICKPSKMYRYLSTCDLTLSKLSFHSNDSYKVQVINKVGDENFTVIISSDVQEDLKSYNPALIGGVVCVVFIFALLVLITVVRKLKRSKEAEESPSTSHCQNPSRRPCML